MHDQHIPGHWPTLLVIGIVMLLVGLFIVALAPLCECPDCHGMNVSFGNAARPWAGMRELICETCVGNHKVTLWKLWKFNRNARLN